MVTAFELSALTVMALIDGLDNFGLDGGGLNSGGNDGDWCWP